jgi:hypothetical protein
MSQVRPNLEEPQVPGREELRLKIEARIRRLEMASGYGLWAMVLFLLVSLAAFNGFSFLPDLSEEARRMLGAPPPGEMISLALVVYAFSAIVRTLARMTRNVKPYLGLMHTAFFVGFYTFYHLSGVLPDNFWAVFFAGISVLGLENFYLWSHSNAAVSKEKELLKSMQGGGDQDR